MNILSGHCREGIIHEDVMDMCFKISPKECIIEPFPKKLQSGVSQIAIARLCNGLYVYNFTM